MTIKVGDRLPAGTLSEYIDVETEGCKVGPNQFQVDALTKGKKVVIFGLPGAFTPTCSAQHVPSYVKHYAELKAKGVDDILCMSVNDAFVMGAWSKDQHAGGKVRMMARRQRRVHQGSRPRARPDCARHGRALPAFFSARRRRRGEGAEHRSARQVRGFGRGDDAQAVGLTDRRAHVRLAIHGGASAPPFACASARVDLLSAQASQNAVELLQAGVLDDDAAGAFFRRIDTDLRAERLGELLLEAHDVRVAASLAARRASRRR